jgi:hypothetical protein
MSDQNRRPAAGDTANGPWVDDQASELINPKNSEPPKKLQDAEIGHRPGVASDLDFLSEHFDLLNEWERGFVRDVSGLCTFTPRQEAKLVSTVAKIRRKLSN